MSEPIGFQGLLVSSNESTLSKQEILVESSNNCLITDENWDIMRHKETSVLARVALIIIALAILACPKSLGTATPPSSEGTQAKAWAILRTGLNHGNVDKRCHAMRALGLLHEDNEAIRLAEEGLRDKHPEVRTADAAALGEMHSLASVPHLQKALADPEVSVALAAAHALVMMKDQTGYEVYYAVLTGRRKGSGGLNPEALIGEQLRTLDEPRKLVEFAFEQGVGFVPYGGYAFDAVRFLEKNKDSSPVRAAAARALVDDPDPRSGQALAEAAHDRKWIVRTAALWALAKRGDSNSLPAVEAALSDDNDAVRYVAAASVLHLIRALPPDRRAGK
jgi:hypothetical protein